MSDIFDEIFNIPEGLVLTEKQRKGLDRLDMVNRLSMIKRYKAQQDFDKKKEDPHYGDATAKELDNYVDNYRIPKWPNYFGPLAPVIDFARNYATMRVRNLDPSDKFFHCKAHYEASTRGKYGSAIAKDLGDLREYIDHKYKGDSLEDCLEDQRANFRGRWGATMGKTLKETCPIHYTKYK